MTNNNDILGMILKMPGVKCIAAETDNPDAKIKLTFQVLSFKKTIEYRLGDIINSIQANNLKQAERKPAPEGFTDIHDVPTEPSSG